MLEESSRPIQLFYCYAREDQAWRDALDSHLSLFRRSRQISVWDEGEIMAGSAWEDEVEAQIEAADIILLLISPDFINSEYINSKEVNRALERHKEKKASVIPILIRQVYWEGVPEPLKRLRKLPSNGKAISSSNDKDEALAEVVKEIGRVISNLSIKRVPKVSSVERTGVPFEHDSRPFPQKLQIKPSSSILKSKTLLLTSTVLIVVIVTIAATYFFSTRSTSTALSPAIATAAVENYNKAIEVNGTMFGFDAQHSHANPYERILSTTTVKYLQPLDSKTTDGAIEAASIVANSQVYAVSKGHNLYVFSDNGTSQPIWIAQIKASISTVPVVVGSTIYVSDESGVLHFFPANGCGEYICNDTGEVLYGKSSGASPTVANGIIYIASHDNKLSAIRTSDHKILWTGQTGREDISTSPAVYQGMVYASVNSGDLYVFKADGCGQPTCAAQWTASFAESDSTGASPTISKVDGMVYIATEGSGVNLFAFRTAGCGQTKCLPAWKAALDSSIGASPAVANGVVYAVSENGTLFALKANGCGSLICSPLWKATLKGQVKNSPTVANGVVYIGTKNGHLEAFDANGCGNSKNDCLPIKDIQVGNSGLTSPTIANGVIYIGSGDSRLYAYRYAGSI